MNLLIDQLNISLVKKSMLLLLMVFFVIPIKQTNAQDKSARKMIRVAPVIIPLELSPGAKVEKIVTVENLLSTPMPLRVRADGVDISGDDGSLVPNIDETSPLSSWITILKEDMILEPNTQEAISILIDIPQKVDFGGYYASINLTPLVPLTEIKGQQIIPRITVLVLASIGVPLDVEVKDIEIMKFDFSNLIYQKPPVFFEIIGRNKSLNHVTAKPIIKFKEIITGREFEEILEDKIILPNRSRKWEYTSLDNVMWSSGIYKSQLNLSIGSGIYQTRVTYIIVFPWAKAILIVLVLIAAIYIIRYPRRIKKAIKELLKTNKNIKS